MQPTQSRNPSSLPEITRVSTRRDGTVQFAIVPTCSGGILGPSPGDPEHEGNRAGLAETVDCARGQPKSRYLETLIIEAFD